MEGAPGAEWVLAAAAWDSEMQGGGTGSDLGPVSDAAGMAGSVTMATALTESQTMREPERLLCQVRRSRRESESKKYPCLHRGKSEHENRDCDRGERWAG